MADTHPNEIIKRIVSDRLKQIDILLKDRKVEEAHEEIREIRQMDPTNPYARAFEERILEIKAKELEAAIMRAELAAASQESLLAAESDETLQEREPEPEPEPEPVSVDEILSTQSFTAHPIVPNRRNHHCRRPLLRVNIDPRRSWSSLTTIRNCSKRRRRCWKTMA
jgi:hypothetical protein